MSLLVSARYWIAEAETNNCTGSIRSNFGWIFRPPYTPKCSILEQLVEVKPIELVSWSLTSLFSTNMAIRDKVKPIEQPPNTASLGKWPTKQCVHVCVWPSFQNYSRMNPLPKWKLLRTGQLEQVFFYKPFISSCQTNGAKVPKQLRVIRNCTA